MKFYRTIFIILIIPLALISQTENLFDENKYKIGLDIGYFHPQKESFSTNYTNYLKWLPLTSLGLQGYFNYSTNIQYFLSVNFTSRKFKKIDKYSFNIIPAFFGLKYLINTDDHDKKILLPYFKAGVGYVYSYFFGNDINFDYEGDGDLTSENIIQKYHSIGFLSGIGVDYAVSTTKRIGLEIKYSYSYAGSIEKGGLGNVGGVNFSIFIIKSF